MKIGKDKTKHFAVCFATAAALGIPGVWLAAGLALGKEYGDKNAAGNHWCWWDLLADALGIAAGYGCRWLLMKIWN